MTHKHVAANLALLCALSNSLSAQTAGTIGGIPPLSYVEMLKKADVVAVVVIDAGQANPSLFHGKVTEPIKGVETDSDVCFAPLSYEPPLVIGAESIVFLVRPARAAYPVASRITQCPPNVAVFSVPQDFSPSIHVVDTTEVVPCVDSPCARTSSRARGGPFTKCVSFPRWAFRDIRDWFPAACPELPGAGWVLKDAFVAHMMRKLSQP